MAEKIDFGKLIIKESEEEKKAKTIDLSSVMGIKDDDLKIRLQSETKKALEELAKKYNLSVSETVRQLVSQGMELLKNGEKK
jgi:DNA-directed RNA polymerase sigma subunit (sigma70/sigma32)